MWAIVETNASYARKPYCIYRRRSGDIERHKLIEQCRVGLSRALDGDTHIAARVQSLLQFSKSSVPCLNSEMTEKETYASERVATDIGPEVEIIQVRFDCMSKLFL